MGLKWTSESKVMVVWICSELPCQILGILIYYRLQSNIQVKSYGYLDFPRDSLFNFKHLNILWDSIKHPSPKWWPFEFARGFHVKFWESRHIIGLKWTSESKSYGRLNLPRDSLSNFEWLDKLWALNGHPSQKLWPFAFARGFLVNFWGSQYIMGLIGHPIQMLWLFEFVQAFIFKFRVSWYIWVSIEHLSQKYWPFAFAIGFNVHFRTSDWDS